MKKAILTAILIIPATVLFAQIMKCTSAVISFDASTQNYEIKAQSKTGICQLNIYGRSFLFSVNVKSFEFPNRLMQEHFNSKDWMNSESFDKAYIIGSIEEDLPRLLAKDGSYPVTVKGALDIHGVRKQVEVKGTLVKSGKTIKATAEFTVNLQDYNISNSLAQFKAVSKQPTITVSAILN